MFLSQFDDEKSEFVTVFSNSENFFFKEESFSRFLKKITLNTIDKFKKMSSKKCFIVVKS